MDDEFTKALTGWVARCQQVIREEHIRSIESNEQYRAARGEQTVWCALPNRLTVEMLQKYARVWSTDSSGSKSCYAFIALEDSHTKTLGMVTRGDVLKPDGWKKPAKHARGNIFKMDDNAPGRFGVPYLR